MRNYRLFKLQALKTGLIFGSNRFGHVWIEVRLKGVLRAIWTLQKPYAERQQPKPANAHFKQLVNTKNW